MIRSVRVGLVRLSVRFRKSVLAVDLGSNTHQRDASASKSRKLAARGSSFKRRMDSASLVEKTVRNVILRPVLSVRKLSDWMRINSASVLQGFS